MTNALARRRGRAWRRTGPGPQAAGAAVLVLSAAVLSACGGAGGSGQVAVKSQATTTGAVTSGSTTGGSTTTTSAATAWASGRPGGGARATFAGPAASGTIASISGNSLEVQNTQSGQTTVEVTAKTRISATADVTLSAVKPGECVTASGTRSAGSGGSGLAATSVVLVSGTGGSCTAFGQGGGRYGSERSGRAGTFTRPTGSRGSLPARLADVRTVTGTVKSVSGTTIEVSGFLRSFHLSSGAATSKSTTATSTTATSTTRPAATTIAVVVGGTTRYQRVGTATVASLKVGECATAFGSANAIGAVTATRLSVAPPTGGSCDTGLGVGGGAGFFGGRLPAAGAGSQALGAPAGTGSALVNTGAAS